jgi:hypothetical protein
MTVALNVSSRNEVAARPIPLCRPKSTTLCSLGLCREPRGACNDHNGHDGEESETGQRTDRDRRWMRGCCCLFVNFGQKWGNRIRLALSQPSSSSTPSLSQPVKIKGYGRKDLQTRTCLGKLARWRIPCSTWHRVPFICYRSGKQLRPCLITRTFVHPCRMYIYILDDGS